jgi:hypothetical protein
VLGDKHGVNRERLRGLRDGLREQPLEIRRAERYLAELSDHPLHLGAPDRVLTRLLALGYVLAGADEPGRATVFERDLGTRMDHPGRAVGVVVAVAPVERLTGVDRRVERFQHGGPIGLDEMREVLFGRWRGAGRIEAEDPEMLIRPLGLAGA